MVDVTDVAFREMFAKYGKPDVFYTEFVNVDGLTHPEGYKRLSQDLKFTEIQRPIVAQLWGREPQKFHDSAKIIAKLGFDGVDINFGCPQDKEIGQKTCAALILEPERAKEIIAATKKGAGGLPVSVKTRLGYSKIEEMNAWLRHLLLAEPAAIALHARTKQEKSKVPAHWGAIAQAVKIRNQIQSNVIARSVSDEAISNKEKIASPSARNGRTLIIGNGDIKSREEGLSRVKETGCDGIMVGRGAFGSPWFFRKDNFEPTIKERLSVMLEHARLYTQEFEGKKSFAIIRKHFKAYANGFDGASELRAELMTTIGVGEVENIVNKFLKTIQ